MNRIKTNRSLIVYILLTILTLGIYGLYYLHALARDINVMCEKDGEHTSGLLLLIFLTIITCGIYEFYWCYKIADRLQVNAPHYGLSFSESGTTILLWLILGSFLCGIGPFVAMHLIAKNTNRMAAAWNAQHGF